jgi:hypothetical protein
MPVLDDTKKGGAYNTPYGWEVVAALAGAVNWEGLTVFVELL